MVRKTSFASRNPAHRMDHPRGNDSSCPAEGLEVGGRKPPQSIRERVDFCSSFLADRGCLPEPKPLKQPA